MHLNGEYWSGCSPMFVQLNQASCAKPHLLSQQFFFLALAWSAFTVKCCSDFSVRHVLACEQEIDDMGCNSWWLVKYE